MNDASNKKAIDHTKDNLEGKPAEAPKPLKPEQKPFDEFINEDFIPSLNSSFLKKGLKEVKVELIQAERPVVGGICPTIYVELPDSRRLWLCFESKLITSTKLIALAESGAEPSVLESFLVDERKITKALLISRLLQRLNGQKWLGAN